MAAVLKNDVNLLICKNDRGYDMPIATVLKNGTYRLVNLS